MVIVWDEAFELERVDGGHVGGKGRVNETMTGKKRFGYKGRRGEGYGEGSAATGGDVLDLKVGDGGERWVRLELATDSFDGGRHDGCGRGRWVYASEER